MTPVAELPAWAALATAAFVLLGAALTLVGSIGLLRLGSFYDRVHGPTLGATLGTGSIVIGSIICFSWVQSQPALYPILIAVFVTMTTPVTLILLARAAVHRDRRAGSDAVPAQSDAARLTAARKD